jgi:hypothetical protein
MKNIKEFIHYYRSCPLCKNWITLDADLPISSAIEIKNDRLVLTIIMGDRKNNKEYSILFDKNKIESMYPFAFNDVVSTLKRLYYSEYKESLKIEARCYGCSNFRYWSKTMIYNERTKRLGNIDISGERCQLHELNKSNEKISYIISNNYSAKETQLFVLRPTVNRKPLSYKIPFMPFKNIDFENKEKLLSKIRNMLILV